jgi:hypothetical protein
MKEEEEIKWEREHPLTHSLLQKIAQDSVRPSKRQRELIAEIVGKMENDFNESRSAQVKLQNHIIWHIEKNNKSTAIYQQNEKK